MATVSVAVAAAGLGDDFGLNKSANVFLAGEAEAAGEGDAAVVIAVFFRLVLAAGSTTGGVEAAGDTLAAVDAAGLAAAFFFDFFPGEAEASAAGDSLAPGDASLAAAFLRDFFAGEAEASAAGDSLAPGDAVSLAAFLRDFFAGEADVAGDALADGDSG